MGENGQPFSIIERFRQLKKEQGQATSLDGMAIPSTSTNTTFQLSTSSKNLPINDFINKDKSIHRRCPGKRTRNESIGERPSKRIAGQLEKGQKEVDCGITEFIREGPGFNVILKSRYTDFQVNEIDYEGNLVKLTSTELILPFPEKSETLSEEEDPTILPPEKWKALRNIVDNKLAEFVDVDVTDIKKEQRVCIHKAVKRRFGAQIYSNTKDVDGKKIMKIGCATDKGDSRWPKDRPEYLHFVLFKENADMSDAINAISKFVGIRPCKFSYAGTKDKRAVTSQWVCLQRGMVEKFKYCYKLRGIAVGNYCYKWKQLRLGDLKGNRFKLALRNLKVSNEATVVDAIEHLKTNGFINYFGLQRFGNSSLVPTYYVGKAILKGDWKLAVELILKPRPGEATFRDVKEAREIWWETRNATDALKKLSRKDRSIEGKILLGLKKLGSNAYQNAFDNLPRQVGTMYLHSYQSLIWNKIVSRRVKQFGLTVLLGDLVKVSSEDKQDDNGTLAPGDDVDGDGDDSDGEYNQAVTEYGEGRIKVKALSEQEAKTTSIFDVVYPLPGDDIQLPANEVATWYKELLEADGYSMASFGNVHKKYGMYGSYRHLLEKPDDLSWHFVQYSDPDQDLLPTELAILRNQAPLQLNPGGPLKALVLEFNLNVCCYATMAVRELTKCDTSTSNQSLLSNQAREESQQSETIKREADADNMINKFLESNNI